MASIGEIIDNTRNAVNSICTEVGLSRIFRRLNRVLYGHGGLMARPIGIVGKNYDFIKNTLYSNIGNGFFTYDGFGGPISSLGDPELNLNYVPWFIADIDKNNYDTYLNYVNSMYFNGYMSPLNFLTQEEKTSFFDYRTIKLENNNVGVVRSYNIYDTLAATTLTANNGQSNPNGFTDTRTGIINNFYLNTTLQNSAYYHDNTNISNITLNAYDKFWFIGDKGMINSDFTIINGTVLSQNDLTDDLFEQTPINSEFGFYDNLSQSDEIINATSYKTRQFIYKSLLGKDLLYDYGYDIDWDDYNLSEQKYYPKKYKTYISVMTDNVGNDSINGNVIRYKLQQVGNGHSTTSRELYVYAEKEGNVVNNKLNGGSFNEGIEYNNYQPYHLVLTDDKKDIISYTNACFRDGKFDTLIARFHTNEYGSPAEAIKSRDMLSSAISQYGMSHGRNLLRKNHLEDSDTNGYSDPYCRVWTFHKQYHKLTNLIRPLYGNSDNISETVISKYQFNRDRLEKYGVRDKSNRLVKIAPTKVNDIKNCMFSIENLAWKYEQNGFIGHDDQKGPLGGRIMWFPPYGLSFSESVNVNWNPTQFIGRGESIYTYTNTERSGSLSFKVLIDHPSLLNAWRYETNDSVNGSVDDVDSNEQKILRFFAGCEILTSEKPPKQKEPEVPIKRVIPETPKPQPIFVQRRSTNTIVFYVFFPNDYSGVDDAANGLVKPIEYLINGIGCQKNNNTDLGTNLSNKYSLQNGNRCGGYELGRNIDTGISCGLDVDNKEVTLSNNVKITTYNVNNKNGKKNNWGYRVDNKYKNEVFRNPKSYYDTTDFGLNGKSYLKLLNYHTDVNKDSLGTLFSFIDVAYALEPNVKNLLDDSIYDEDRAKIISELIDEYDVVSVEANGYASSHGYVKNNNELNENRAKTVLDWLNKCNPTKFTKSKCKVVKTGIGNKLSHNNATSIDAKVWRCVRVVINLEKEELVEQQQTSNETNDELTNVGKISTESAIENANNNAEDNLLQANNNSSSSSATNYNDGYGDEYKFFSSLEKNSPFLHNKVVDKIKYFDPAYHSITPEGFNARLTFLHQCTRQGSTKSASDFGKGRTSSNLSFGAPPICVLRIGDFYNTKIIIESLQIDYEDITWDLNDEGIGVMPMIANINISFKFLGGSDLSGPITRLQNAVSFNYYANTTVYEDRSELVEYDDKGQIISLKKNR